jgi:uncharacterized 2Fe-2S/4Fe-4S cluster protein (DUF4445 family)
MSLSDFGIAIDIGTTTVSLSLVDVSKEKRVDLVSSDNPQAKFGEDVISRIEYQNNRKNQRDLTLIIREHISSSISKLLSKNHLNSGMVSDVVIVGNTPMHHLFFDLPTISLLREPFVTGNTGSIETTAIDFGLDLPQARCYAPPLIESFVGSDALGVILGFGIAYDVNPSLALDIGTNSEIIVQYNSKLWVASAASGPAFEGMSLACGTKAEEGAIDRVVYDDRSKTLRSHTIGNKEPMGVCGVGAISALYSFRLAGLLTSQGSINRNLQSESIYSRDSIYGVIIGKSSQSPIYLNQMDIRMLQQSKAAIRAVTELLLHEANVKSTDIRNLYVTGAFGNGLDIQAATGIDMIPHLPTLDNTNQQLGGALLGAELLLWNQHSRLVIDEVLQSINYIDMMNHPLYSELQSKFSLFP